MVEFTPLHAAPPPSPDDRWIPVAGNRVLLATDADGEPPRPLRSAEVDALGDQIEARLVLGELGDATWWTAVVAKDFEPGDDQTLSDLRRLIPVLDDATFNIAGRATQVADWHRDNRYCGRCGGPMSTSDSDRAMVCPDDGYRAYPRLSPAVIVLIERDDGRALLARNVNFPMPMYSTLAGFVEPGESLEDTIIREMREEVGVEVSNLRYYASQPWPFPNSLMLGFIATYAGGEIVPEEGEIADAQWFSTDDLPMIPPKASIARALIDDWISRN